MSDKIKFWLLLALLLMSIALVIALNSNVNKVLLGT
jgi:hypothetical protein